MSVSEILNIGSAAAGVTSAKGRSIPHLCCIKKWANWGSVYSICYVCTEWKPVHVASKKWANCGRVYIVYSMYALNGTPHLCCIKKMG